MGSQNSSPSWKYHFTSKGTGHASTHSGALTLQMHSDDIKEHRLAPHASTSSTEPEGWLQEGTLGSEHAQMTGVVLNQLTAHFRDH